MGKKQYTPSERRMGAGRARNPKRHVPKSQRIKRRQLLSAMIANGATGEEIVHQMQIEFGMTQRAIQKLMNEVVQSWADEEVERRPHWKRAAIKRMHGHIAAARAEKQWTAVASLERLLAQMQGTMEPVVLDVNVDATVRESVINVVAMASPARVQQLAEQALRMRKAARLPSPAPPVVQEPEAAE